MTYNCGFAKKLCEFVELFMLDRHSKRKCVLDLFSLALYCELCEGLDQTGVNVM